MLAPRDVVFAISFSPYNSITPALAATARQKGAAVLAITDSPLSPLAPLSRAWLEINEVGFWRLSLARRDHGGRHVPRPGHRPATPEEDAGGKKTPPPRRDPGERRRVSQEHRRTSISQSPRVKALEIFGRVGS